MASAGRRKKRGRKKEEIWQARRMHRYGTANGRSNDTHAVAVQSVVELSWRRFEVGSRSNDARTETVKTAQFRRVRRTVVGVRG